MKKILVMGNVREEALATLRDFAELVLLAEPVTQGWGL